MSLGLDRDDILSLLDDLNDELRRRGAHGELFLVGGAALALVYDTTRSTRDLDAVFLPTAVVRTAAAAVAERRGLEIDWLNDAVKGFLPGPDPDSTRYYDGDSLTVDVASARYLLAMKLLASRVETDADDIALLYRRLGFTTVEEGLDLLAQAYKGRTLDPKVQYLLAEIVELLDVNELGDDQASEQKTLVPADPLAVARRHADETAAAREQMLVSARARRAAILEAHRRGMSIRRIASELGCSAAVVQEAVRVARAETETDGGQARTRRPALP
jgi:hypothetical protein